MHEALCRSSGTTLDSVHAEDGPPITQRTSGLRVELGRLREGGSMTVFGARPSRLAPAKVPCPIRQPTLRLVGGNWSKCHEGVVRNQAFEPPNRVAGRPPRPQILSGERYDRLEPR
jgi:hypothetical protein